jgi:hypothetical protein
MIMVMVMMMMIIIITITASPGRLERAPLLATDAAHRLLVLTAPRAAANNKICFIQR